MTRSLHDRLADLVAEASDNAVTPAEALIPGASLTDLGMDSLGLLRLIDTIEDEYGVSIDLGGDEPVDSVAALAALLCAAMPQDLAESPPVQPSALDC
jgi:acyl carrier protein